MSIVYVIREPVLRREVELASHFGELRYCLGKNETNTGPGPILNRLRSTLRNYEERDYILWAGGDWITLVALGIVLSESNIRNINLLVWKKDKTAEKQKGAYIPQRMVL